MPPLPEAEKTETAEAAVAAARAASLEGRHAQALGLIIRAGRVHQGLDIGEPLRDIGRAAIAGFNERLAAGDFAGAEPIIEGLTLLMPEQLQQTALTVAQRLGKLDRMEFHATQLLQRRPDFWHAHAALLDVATARGDLHARLYHQAKVALLRDRTANGDDWMLSSEAYHAASHILINPPMPELLPLVEELRTAVAALPQQFSKDDDRNNDLFMRACLDGADLTILDEPLSDDLPPQPALQFADAHGEFMDFDRMRQRILAGAPKLVLMAAADEVYLRRYGRTYLDSILQRCDVDCAVILCMIGEPSRLKDVIEAIGIRDERLFYLVDTFDPAYAVSFYTPQGCIPDCARAYYQSVRFLVLDFLLRGLDIPLAVTDIDVLLQGSVAELLEQNAGEVVLNRNEGTVSFGARYTANLVLVRPGRTAWQFTRQVRLFLERALRRRHIEQFVDQTALTLACYYSAKRGLDRIGFFHKSAINNVMLNRTRMGESIVQLARQFVFFAYYGSQGDSALALMKAVSESHDE